MPAGRPSEYLNWTDGSSPKVVEPPSAIKSQGWFPGEAPPAPYTNWQIWLLDQWIQYLDGVVSPGIPDQVMRLMNGGFWSFNATTGVVSWSATANISFAGVPDSNNALAAGSVTLADGDVGFVSVNTPFVTKGDTTLGSNVIANIDFTGNLEIGMTVTGPGIPGSTTVLSVGTSSVTISNNATSSNVQATYIYSNTGALTMQVALNTAFVPDFTDILVLRRSGSQVYVGVNTGQMVLRDGEFKTLLGSGYFTVYSALAGQNLTAGQLVYISAGASDGGRTAGSLYPLDVSAANQLARGTFAGVVISNVNSGLSAQVVFNGFYAFNSLTPGAPYYADPTVPGGITSTFPGGSGVKIVQVGMAVNSGSLLVTGVQNGGSSLTQPIINTGIVGYGDGSTVSFPLPGSPVTVQSAFIWVDGVIVTNADYSISGGNVIFGTAPGPGQEIYARVILNGQAYLLGNQEVPTGVVNGTNATFALSFQPLNQDALEVYIDGLIQDKSLWTLDFTGSTAQIVFNTPPPGGSDIYVANLSPVGSGSVPGIIDAHGSAAAPVTIVPSVGVVVSSALEQVWWLTPPSGAVPVTANPQITPGNTIGQRLVLKGTSNSNYYTFANGNGLDLDGGFNLDSNQSVTMTWDGTNWSEDSRRA